MDIITANESYLIEYITKGRSGEILIGHELMAMLDILDEDLHNPDIRFELAEPHKRIKFVEHECRHSISPFAGKPFLLELWEKAFIEAVYGFKVLIHEEWRRKYTRALLLIGRKNGKTSFCAALGNAEFFCGPAGTNVLCASNDYEQAGMIFDEINNMREESPHLDKISRKNIKGIFMGGRKQKKKKGKFSAQNKAKIKKLSIKTGAKEGKNLDFAIIDEVHEMKDNSLVMPVWQSMSTKPEPLLIEITTQGQVNDGYLDKRLIDARKILNGESTDARTLIWMYTQDSEEEVWQDKRTWVKSNPNLGVAKQWDFLEGVVEEARTNSATRAFVLPKDFNIKQSSAASWMQESEIINPATYDMESMRGAYAIYGNDFMETTDLCASKALIKKPGDPMIYFISHYWIPNEKLEHVKPEAKIGTEADDEDYRQWERDGYMTIVPGNSVPSSVAAEWQYALYTEYDIKPYKSGYDNRFAKDYLSKFEDFFGENILEMVPQESKCLNNPMRRLESDLRSKHVNYNNCHGDLVCFRNTGIEADKLGRVRPTKKETKKRIDGTAAALCCYAILDWHGAEYDELITAR